MKDTEQWGFRRIGKRKDTIGYLNKYESQAKPFEFAYGTIWATSLRGAQIKLGRELKKRLKV